MVVIIHFIEMLQSCFYILFIRIIPINLIVGFNTLVKIINVSGIEQAANS